MDSTVPSSVWCIFWPMWLSMAAVVLINVAGSGTGSETLIKLRPPILSAGSGVPEPSERHTPQLGRAQPPTSARVAFLASFAPTLIGTWMLAGGLYWGSEQRRDPVVPLGIAGLGLGVLLFAPNFGDLLNEDVVRFTAHGLIRVGLVVGIFAILALAASGSSDAPILEFYAATALGLGGFVFAIYDAATSYRAPDRWRERNLPPVRAARVAWAF